MPSGACPAGSVAWAATDSGLVGNDEKSETGRLKLFQSCDRPGQDFDLLHFVEIAFLGDDGSVTIQKHGAVHSGGSVEEPPVGTEENSFFYGRDGQSSKNQKGLERE